MRHFLSTEDWSRNELQGLLDRGQCTGSPTNVVRTRVEAEAPLFKMCAKSQRVLDEVLPLLAQAVEAEPPGSLLVLAHFARDVGVNQSTAAGVMWQSRLPQSVSSHSTTLLLGVTAEGLCVG